jgi:hypothetical protein
MRSILSLLVFCFSASLPCILAAEHVARSTKCDVSQALSVLESLSTGASFCSSYIHVSGVSTKTKTTTITVSADCTTSSKTKTVHATVTSTYVRISSISSFGILASTNCLFSVYGKTTTLPVITVTIYSSTVLVARYSTLSQCLCPNRIL